MKKLFKRYKIIKSKLVYNYKEYPMHNILSLEIISLVYAKKKLNVKDFAYLVLTRKINIDNSKKILFSIGGYKRDDYYELLNYVRKDIDSSLVDLSKIKSSFKISLKNIGISFKHIFFNDIDLSFKNKLSLAITMTYILNIIDDLENNRVDNIQKFCSFCSNLNYEGILDYYFQKNSIQTYTLQHGLWFIYDSYPIDLVAYENLISQNLLCWGDYTKQEFKKFGVSQEKIKVAGYPRNIHPLVVKKVKKLKILVLFARVQYHKNNLDIVEILKKLKLTLNIEVEFKLHPSLDKKIYEDIAYNNNFTMADNKTIKELMKDSNYTFSIVYNSTAYYDSYLYNCISLQYKDIDADNSIDIWNDSFKTLKELQEKIEFFTIKNTEQNFWDETEEKLKYILGYGTNNYKGFLDVT